MDPINDEKVKQLQKRLDLVCEVLDHVLDPASSANLHVRKLTKGQQLQHPKLYQGKESDRELERSKKKNCIPP